MFLEGLDPTLLDLSGGIQREVLVRTMADARRDRMLVTSVRRWAGRRLVQLGLVVAAEPRLRPDPSR